MWSYVDEWGYDAIAAWVRTRLVCDGVCGRSFEGILRLLRVISRPLWEHPDKRVRSVHSIFRNACTIFMGIHQYLARSLLPVL